LIGQSLGPIAKAVGYTTYASKLAGTLETLMKDESSEVRLGVCKSVYDIYLASDQSLLSQTQNLIGTFLKDTQYKIRENIVEAIAKLGSHYGLEIFKSNFESLFFSYLNDTVYSVRETGTANLEVIFNI